MESKHEYIKDGSTLQSHLSRSETIDIEIGRVQVAKNIDKIFFVGSTFALIGGIHYANMVLAFGGIGGLYGSTLALLQHAEHLNFLRYESTVLNQKIGEENLPKQYVKK